MLAVVGDTLPGTVYMIKRNKAKVGAKVAEKVKVKGVVKERV